MQQHFSLLVVFAFGGVLVSGMVTEIELRENVTTASPDLRISERRPSFWTKTVNNLKASTMLRMQKPYDNLTKLQKRIAAAQGDTKQVTEMHSAQITRKSTAANHFSDPGVTMEYTNYGTTTPSPTTMKDDIEEEIMKDESFIGLKEFANQLINDTARLLTRKGQPRSYPVEEPSQHQVWDDKDQTYHASSYAAAEYDPGSFHHHYIPSPPLHYYPPPKKEDTLLTKVTMIALLKLILAKLKAIGFLKLMFLLMMKVPIMLLKFLFILKTFKLIKLVSIPLIVASLAAPLLPLLPLLAPLLLAPLLLVPLMLPLLLPLLFFLPIIPISSTITASSTRERREAKSNPPEEEAIRDETRARHLKNRIRPSSAQAARRNIFDYPGKWNQYEAVEENSNILELIQKIADSQNCIERVACELASHNESKIYQSAVEWALEKIHSLASQRVRRKLERYTEAYKTGSKWHSSDICSSKFTCQRPKIFLVQGMSKYNVI